MLQANSSQLKQAAQLYRKVNLHHRLVLQDLTIAHFWTILANKILKRSLFGFRNWSLLARACEKFSIDRQEVYWHFSNLDKSMPFSIIRFVLWPTSLQCCNVCWNVFNGCALPGYTIFCSSQCFTIFRSLSNCTAKQAWEKLYTERKPSERSNIHTTVNKPWST